MRSMLQAMAVMVVIFVLSNGASAQGIGDTAVPLLNGTDRGKVLYSFTGAVATGNNLVGAATVVHCTNVNKPGAPTALVGVELFNFYGGGPVNDITMGELVEESFPSSTITFATQNTAIFSEDEVHNTLLVQGSGRVISTSSRVVCTAQVVSDASSVTSSLMQLPMFKKTKQGGQ